jgi:hypothetical protein
MYSISLLVSNFLLLLLHLRLWISWRYGMAHRCLFLLNGLML